ncbi:MAG: 2'-deoxycytidine 5'-triphosphate deaminase [Acidobacteria bacterium]|nr:2'-deoxycytidine 5'-triphosphate deaminase [Acidobacteriota bacterium]MBV9479944.1 2'-deoxycytidine 5'-triphosphate deaminase [Acidobacteriota bacterium]
MSSAEVKEAKPTPTDLAGREEQIFTTGLLPSQLIRRLIEQSRISASPAIVEEQIQPASLDLRLGEIAHRVQASFLPGQLSTVEDRIRDLRMMRVDLTRAAILEKGCVYIVPLVESLELPADISARANPKSTTGRLDIFTRLITDYGAEFESVSSGYKGKLYAEIVPRTFTVAVRAGMRLNQLRFVRGKPVASDRAISALDEEKKLVYLDEHSPIKAQVDRGLMVSVNLEAGEPSEVIAYRAKRNSPAIELDKIDYYSPDDFWDIRQQPKNKTLILDPGDFYILASKERVRVPPEYAAEMIPIDPSVGEFRIHYAGFFDPGFGYGVSDIKGTRAVLEVRAHEVPFLIEHRQVVGRLKYMRLLHRPDKIYGTDIGSSYQRQELTLSKQFRRQ